MSTNLVYRVQDREGRGPWRPGFSAKWLHDSDLPLPAAFFEEFGWRLADVPRMFRRGEFGGCGCRTLEQLARWITSTEAERLRVYGYVIVRMTIDRVLAESENQVVFARRKPLSQDVEIIPWPVTIAQ
jgi:hypothetical protein